MRIGTKARWSSAMVIAVTAGSLSVAGAQDSPLEQGLQHLRAGEQELAKRHLARYLDGENDPEVRARVEQTLLAMREPVSAEAGQMLAINLEAGVRAHLAFKQRLALDWRNRTFPPFP